MNLYRALNGEEGPVVVCDDDEPGTVMAMTGRQQDAEEIAAALNLLREFADHRADSSIQWFDDWTRRVDAALASPSSLAPNQTEETR